MSKLNFTGNDDMAQAQSGANEPDFVEILSWFEALFDPHNTHEVRVFNANLEGYTKPQNLSGRFTKSGFRTGVLEAISFSGSSSGVYVTQNPVMSGPGDGNSSLGIARSCAKDSDIAVRRWLFVDVDPIRPSEVSSTDQEKEAAWSVAEAVQAELREAGWPEPLVADSGNGFHMLYRINLPTQDGGLVRRVLGGLARRFDTPTVKIDQAVHNPSRLIRFYGTLNRKGESTPERPHRLSKVVDLPDSMEVVSKEQLEDFAAEFDSEVVRQPLGRGRPSLEGLDLSRIQEKARRKLETLSPAISGDGGHNRTFRAACILTHGFQLTPEEAYPVLAEWNEKCVPPWSERELRHKLDDASKKEGPKGYFLNACFDGGFKPSADDGIVCSEHVNDPHWLANRSLTDEFRSGPSVTLRHWNERWWEWRDSRYIRVSDGEVKSRTTAKLPSYLKERSGNNKGVPATQLLVTDVLGAMKGLCHLPDSTSFRTWLGSADEFPGDDVIATEKCRIHLASTGVIESLLPNSPLWFSPIALPVEFDPTATAPMWQAFLEKNLENDAERIALLQEWFGYCLTPLSPETSLQKFLLLEGDGCNGKSVVCAALTALLGSHNVSNVGLEQFSSRFGLHSMLGKLANVASEMGEIAKVEEGVLKALTSGDAMTFEEKFKSPIEASPTAKLVFATNNRPRFLDRSSGVWRRILLFPFRVEIKPEEKVVGMDHPSWWSKQGELPGILNWALEGNQRLRQNGEFTEPAICKTSLEQYRRECNPAREFLETYCEVDENWCDVLSKEELRDYYKGYCSLFGCHPLGDAAFGKEVMKAFPNLKSSRGRVRGDTNRPRGYQGLKCNGPRRASER